MHSLFALAPHLKSGQFLLSTVDAVFREDEFASYLHHAGENQTADGILAITDFIDDENPLYVRLDESRRIKSFSKSESSPWITGGLYIFNPKIFDEMDAVLKKKIERLRNFLGHLVERGYNIEGYPFSKMIDIDHVRDIDTAREWIAGMNAQPLQKYKDRPIKVR